MELDFSLVHNTLQTIEFTIKSKNKFIPVYTTLLKVDNNT